METRKVQMTGGSTYVVSLPKKWVKKVNIKSGDSLGIIPRSDDSLLLNPKVGTRNGISTKITIVVESNDPEELVRKFIGAYLAGYSIIEITRNPRLTKETRQKIVSLTHWVIGPEIIDETESTMTIKDLLDASDFSFVIGVKRMYLITKGMLTDAISALVNGDDALATDVESRDDEVDKLNWMIAKQYNLVLRDIFFAERMQVNSQVALGYLQVARIIERIADHAKKIATNAKLLNSRPTTVKRIESVSKDITRVLDVSIEAFYSNRFKSANDVVNQCKSKSKDIEKLKQLMNSTDVDPVTAVSLAYTIDSLDRTLSYILDIAEISINHQMASDYSSK